MRVVVYCIFFFTFMNSSAQLSYQIIEQVDASRIESDIRKLVSFGTRHTMSETKSDSRGIGAARR